MKKLYCNFIVKSWRIRFYIKTLHTQKKNHKEKINKVSCINNFIFLKHYTRNQDLSNYYILSRFSNLLTNTLYPLNIFYVRIGFRNVIFHENLHKKLVNIGLMMDDKYSMEDKNTPPTHTHRIIMN